MSGLVVSRVVCGSCQGTASFIVGENTWKLRAMIGMGEVGIIWTSAAELCARVAHVVVLVWHGGWQEVRCSVNRQRR